MVAAPTARITDYFGGIHDPRMSQTKHHLLLDFIAIAICEVIASLEPNAQLALCSVRSRWGIENDLRWVLDIAYRKDESRVRKDHGPENLATLRHMALNLLQQEHTAKVGIHAKRLNVGWDEAYLLKALQS